MKTSGADIAGLSIQDGKAPSPLLDIFPESEPPLDGSLGTTSFSTVYKPSGSTCVLDGVDDAAEWEATKAALRVMCATDGDRNGDQNGDVWRVLSSVLHLGDISFDVSPYGHATVCASAGVGTARQPLGGDAVGVNHVDVALAPSACAAEMLGVDVAALESALTKSANCPLGPLAVSYYVGGQFKPRRAGRAPLPWPHALGWAGKAPRARG